MSPHETFFLTPTTKVEPHLIDNNPYIQFTIKDYPGNYELRESSPSDVQAIKNCGTLIYVIDAQPQDYEGNCNKLRDIIKTCSQVNKNIQYEVFIHKIDSDLFLSDEQKMDCLNEIQENMRQLCTESNLQVSLSFYLTSIYDHSIYESLSKVIQKLLPQVSFITSMIDNLINTSKIEKAFLFDVISKIYIATDSNPVEIKHYEICSELIDVLIDVSCIYGIDEQVGTLKFDKESSSIIKLNHAGGSDEKIVLYLREVDKCLALVCLINDKEFHKQHLINYNIDKFKEGLRKIFEATKASMKR
jgi:Ras-related GTP-binding protein C/D